MEKGDKVKILVGNFENHVSTVVKVVMNGVLVVVGDDKPMLYAKDEVELVPNVSYVVMVGNPFDGMESYGPFNNANDAIEYGDDNHDNETWWVVAVRGVK